MMGGRESSVCVWGGLACQALAVLFICISLGTSCWVWGTVGESRITLGLWMGCMDGLCVKLSEAGGVLQHQMGAWVLWCQVSACIGFSLFLLGLLLAVFFQVCGTYMNNPSRLLLTAAMSPAAAVLYGFSLMLYNYNTHYPQLHYGFSLYLGLLGLGAGLLAAISFTREHGHQMRPSQGYIRLN